MFCTNCGSKIEKKDSFCPNCGTPTKEKKVEKEVKNEENDMIYTQPVNMQQGYAYPPQYVIYAKPKIPGNGSSIAGMVLGIIAAVYGFAALVSPFSDDFKETISEYEPHVTAFAFGIALIPFVLSVTGLPLSISGFLKQKNGKNVSGIILNSIALVLAITAFILVVTMY